MANLHIDTSNVKLMSEFKDAVEEYVNKYVSSIIQGLHGKQTLTQKATASSCDAQKEIIPVSLKINVPLVKHWGILNIKRVNTNDSLSQVIFWWDNGNFKYQISYNSLLACDMNRFQLQTIQYIDSIAFNEDGNELSFNIINDVYSNSTTKRENGNFEVYYHIW